MVNPLISIIIPAYNEEKYIATALESTQRQSYDRLERIVVANACTDNTARVARNLGASVIETDRAGRAYASNLGAKAANGDIYVFFDADSIMKDNLIETVVANVQDGYEVGKARIWPIETGLKEKIFSGCWDLNARILTLIPGIDSGSGALAFSTKELFKKLEEVYGYGYNPDMLTLADVDFAVRAKKHGNFKYITESGILTSMRRFNQLGFFSCLFEDAFNFINKKKRPNRRWIR